MRTTGLAILLTTLLVSEPAAVLARSPRAGVRASRKSARRADASAPAQTGALIRTEGLGARVGAADPQRLHSVEGGNRIGYDAAKGQNTTNHVGLFVGKPDKLPNPNGQSGGTASGKNAITPNP